MKNHLKVRMFGDFFKNLKENHQDLDEKKRYAICYDIHKVAFEIYMREIKSFSDSHNEKSLVLEQHRKEFHQYIVLIEKSVKNLLTKFKKEGFVKVEYDNKTKKPYLKGRTTMVDDMVVFLNSLNEVVMTFYKDVYKIETKQKAKEFGIEQINLFD